MVLDKMDKQTYHDNNFQSSTSPPQLPFNMASSRRGSGRSAPIANFQLMVTGPHAKNLHPGVPDQKAKYRMAQEMKEIREKEALKKEKTKEKQKNSIKNVAQIEDDLCKEQQE